MKIIPDSELLNAGYRYALALTMNRQDAEDILHDAWIRLVTRYRKSPDKPVLFRTIKNLFIDGKRHAKVVDNYVRDVDKSVESSGQENTIINEQMLEYHLEVLRPIEREVLFLSVVEGYTADEIAAMQSTVRGTILSMLSRSKKKLRESMQREDSKEESNVVDGKAVDSKRNVVDFNSHSRPRNRRLVK